MKRLRTRILPYIALLALLFAMSLQVQAKSETVTVTEVSATTASVAVKGTTEALAVMVQIRDTSDNIIKMESFGTQDGKFSATVTDLSLTASTKYKVYVADYEGGNWAKEEVTASATPDNSGSGSKKHSSNSSNEVEPTATPTATVPVTPIPTVEKPVNTPSKNIPSEPVLTPSEETKKVTEQIKENVTLAQDSEEAWQEIAKEVDIIISEALKNAGFSEDEIASIMDSGKLGSDVIETPIEIAVDMGEATVVSATILEAIEGKNIDLVLEMTDGIIWIINGSTVSSAVDADLDVKFDQGDIPSEAIDSISDGNETVCLSLAHDGKFGFSAVLVVNLGTENAGQIANLFYYNPETGAYEFINAVEIATDGSASLDFEHASDYTIVISEVSMASAEIKKPVESQEENIEEVELEKATMDEGNSFVSNVVMILVIVIVVVGAITGVVIMRRKKNEE